MLKLLVSSIEQLDDGVAAHDNRYQRIRKYAAVQKRTITASMMSQPSRLIISVTPCQGDAQSPAADKAHRDARAVL
jgi:hypothetical protein